MTSEAQDNPCLQDDGVNSYMKSMERVRNAQDELLRKLFGEVPDNPYEHMISRSAYIEALKEVKQEYELEEGDPDMVLFVLEQLSRSPRFKEEGEEV